MMLFSYNNYTNPRAIVASDKHNDDSDNKLIMGMLALIMLMILYCDWRRRSTTLETFERFSNYRESLMPVISRRHIAQNNLLPAITEVDEEETSPSRLNPGSP